MLFDQIKVLRYVFFLMLALRIGNAEAQNFLMPSNVRESFAYELTHNDGLSESDLKRLAKEILKRNHELSEDQAVVMLQEMSLTEIKKIASEEFFIEYFEIPKEVLKKKFSFYGGQAEDLGSDRVLPDREIINGKEYVRFFIHPLSTNESAYSEFHEFKKKGRYTAVFSASRSLPIFDIKTKQTWSVKPSLNVAPGLYSRKHYSANEAYIHFNNSQYVLNLPELESNFLPDIAWLGMVDVNNSAIDEGQTVRDLKSYSRENRILSTASVFDESFLTEMAQANGMSEEDFYKEKIAKETARIIAAMIKRGFYHNSPHSQNFVMVLDQNRKFKKMKFRDPDFSYEKESLPKELEGRIKEHVESGITFAFSLGAGVRSKLSPAMSQTYKEGALVYFSELIFELTGIKLTEEQTSLIRNQINGSIKEDRPPSHITFGEYQLGNILKIDIRKVLLENRKGAGLQCGRLFL